MSLLEYYTYVIIRILLEYYAYVIIRILLEYYTYVIVHMHTAKNNANKCSNAQCLN